MEKVSAGVVIYGGIATKGSEFKLFQNEANFLLKENIYYFAWRTE
jgi:hypothetical protein